jgi:hypothetical protein
MTPNGPVLCARWRFNALTFNLPLMMIEAQMFNLPLHRHWRKTPVSCLYGRFKSTNFQFTTNVVIIFFERWQKYFK